MLVFTAPSAMCGRSAGGRPASADSWAKARFRPSVSTGSPSEVPVPCVSMWLTVSGDSAARWYAWTSTCAWASGLGAVSEVERPPWLTAVARITPWMWSPSASARSRRLSTTAPAPSPRT